MASIAPIQLRPTRFSEMVGQDKILAAIRRQISSGREPCAWMFSGESGCGKTTLARILSVSLNCVHQEKFGEPCDACTGAAGSSFGIYEVNASEVNGVEAIQAIAQTSRLRPIRKRRVIILDEAQRLTTPAQNLLLKYFEDAPQSTVWIITTTERDKIINTLQRRCNSGSYTLNGLSSKGIEDLLTRSAKQLGVTRPTDDLAEAANRANVNSPGFLLAALEKYAQGIDPDVAVSNYAVSVDSLVICRALVDGEWPPIRAQLEKASNDDFVGVQVAVLGYLRNILLNRKPSVDVKKVAQAILDLGRVGWNQDPGSRAAMVAAELKIICDRGF